MLENIPKKENLNNQHSKAILKALLNLFKQEKKEFSHTAFLYKDLKLYFNKIVGNLVLDSQTKSLLLQQFNKIIRNNLQKIQYLYVIVKYISLSEKVDTLSKLQFVLENLNGWIEKLIELMEQDNLKWSDLNYYNCVYEKYFEFFRKILSLIDKQGN